MQTNKQNLATILKDHFGLENFRAGQVEAICTLID